MSGTDWRNIGWGRNLPHRMAAILTPWGNLIIEHADGTMLFSQRYGLVPMLTIGPLRFTWRRLR